MKKSSQNSKIETSVVIVNFNTWKLLKKCVESVVKSCSECEVVVVDNGSMDEGVTPLRLKASEGHGDIKVIENKENVGFATANNQGIKIAKGEYILLLNPDTQVEGKAINKLVEFAKAHKDAGVVGAKLILPGGTTQKSVFRFPTVWRTIAEFWFGKNTYSSYTPLGDSPQEVDAVVGAAFLITPQAREKVGLLDERYFMYFEDLDYCRRVNAAALKVYYFPQARVLHYHGVSGRTLAKSDDQWKRLLPSSTIYHGWLKHTILNFVIWFGSRVLRRYV